jgi:hypothetical protein
MIYQIDTYFIHTDRMYRITFKKIFNILIILLKKLKSAEAEGFESFIFQKKESRLVGF